MMYIAISPIFLRDTRRDVAPGELVELTEEQAAILGGANAILPGDTPLFHRVDERRVYAFVDGTWCAIGEARTFSSVAIRSGKAFPEVAPVEVETTPKKK